MFNPTCLARTVGAFPKLVGQLIEVERTLALQGLYICIPPDGGFRTATRQAQLWAEGRTVPGATVTNARDGAHSNHCYGLAFDVVPYTDETRSQINWKPNTPQFQRMVATIKAAGFDWGGNWTGDLGDFDHFQMRGLPSTPSPAMIADYARSQVSGGSLSAIWAKAEAGAYKPL